jgi:hypothetical protein
MYVKSEKTDMKEDKVKLIAKLSAVATAAAILAACGGSNSPDAVETSQGQTTAQVTSMEPELEDEALDGLPSAAVLVDEAPRQVSADTTGQFSVEMAKFATWATGYCERVYVTNTSASPASWKVTVPVSGVVTRAWNAVWSVASGRLMAEGESFNRELAAGETTDFGFCADTSAAATPAPAPAPAPAPKPAPAPTVNKAPTIEFTSPAANMTVTAGYQLGTLVKATDSDGTIKNVILFIGDRAVRAENAAPYTFGRESPNNKSELEGLSPGTYTIRAVATDNSGGQAEDKFTLTVKAPDNSGGNAGGGNSGGECNLDKPAKGIPKDISLFTVRAKTTERKDFCKVDKWYDESDNKQVFSLFSGDNFTDFNPQGRSHARTEAQGGANFKRSENKWHQFEADMLFNTLPTRDNGAVTLAQIFAGCCGPVLRIEITESGILRYGSTYHGGGNFSKGNTSYANKPFKVKLRTNGSQVEAYMDGELRYSGPIRRYNNDENANYGFRWGVYSHEPKETLTNTVTNVTRD